MNLIVTAKQLASSPLSYCLLMLLFWVVAGILLLKLHPAASPRSVAAALWHPSQ